MIEANRCKNHPIAWSTLIVYVPLLYALPCRFLHCVARLLLSQWLEMFIDDMGGNDMTKSRATWKGEIDEWLERLKTMEKDLGLKEKELRQREMILRQREKSLEEQFHVVVSILCLFCNCFTSSCNSFVLLWASCICFAIALFNSFTLLLAACYFCSCILVLFSCKHLVFVLQLFQRLWFCSLTSAVR